jgi:hypothetical protein
MKSFTSCPKSLYGALLILTLLTGCASPTGRVSKYMSASVAAPATPPPGRTLVCIHRPKARQGYPLYTGLWDGTNFFSDLGNGHSVAYVCDPGKHFFINRSVEVVGVVQADLLPDKTYDLWIDTAGAFIASFKIRPLKPGDQEYPKLAKWLQTQLWVAPATGTSQFDYEQSTRAAEVAQIIQDFGYGSKKGRLQYLAPEDHR